MSLQTRIRSAIDLVAALAMIATAGVVLWSAFRARVGTEPGPDSGRSELAAELMPLDGAHRIGDPSASIAIIEYGDFECPACARFATDTLPVLKRQFIDSGRVQFGFRHFPLRSHKRAHAAAVAASCAGEQNRFFEFFGALFDRFDDSSNLTTDGLKATAESIVPNSAAWSRCIADIKSGTRIGQDLAEAKRLALRGTPTFFVGWVGKDGLMRVSAQFSGTRPVEDFGVAIDAAEVAASRK